MTKTIDQAIDELVAEITEMEGAVRAKKVTVNTLCGVAVRDELYVLEAPEGSVPTRIRPDQFYGQPLASAVRTILEMRKQQNLGAATNKEIYEALVAGGYQFQTKSEDVSLASLRNSLSKNTTTFHKLPNGRFGMLAWYPNAKAAKPAANSNGDAGETEAETGNEEAAAEPATAS